MYYVGLALILSFPIIYTLNKTDKDITVKYDIGEYTLLIDAANKTSQTVPEYVKYSALSLAVDQK